jgi:uracil-DNA glycosylase family 4
MAGFKTATMDRAAALAALRWWVDAGVDVICADTPTSWLRAQPASAAQPSAARSEPLAAKPAHASPARATSPAANPASCGDPVTLARAADTPSALLAAARAFAGPSALLYNGAPESSIMFVTDAPTQEDMREMRLFSGDPGHLLDRMLAAIGLDRSRACLATAALRPGGDAHETAFVQRLIALTRPRALVALGGLAAARLTDDTRGLNRLRGQDLRTSSDNEMFPVLATFAPAHLIANPQHKALAWADLLALRTSLAG